MEAPDARPRACQRVIPSACWTIPARWGVPDRPAPPDAGTAGPIGTCPASGSPAFDAKGRTLRRLANAGEHALTEVRAQSLAQADGRGGFAFPQWGRCDGSHVNIFSVRNILQPFQHIQFYFRLIIPIKLNFIRQQSGFFRHLGDWFKHRGLGDINIGGNRLQQGQCRGGKSAQSRFLFKTCHLAPFSLPDNCRNRQSGRCVYCQSFGVAQKYHWYSYTQRPIWRDAVG